MGNPGFWLMDIPQMEKDGSLQKYVSTVECIKIIHDIYSGANPTLTEGLYFENF